MKLFFRSLLAVALSLGFTTNALTASNTGKLPEHEIRWSGSMPAKSHEGLLSLKDFKAEISPDGAVQSLTAVVDMTKIDVTDLSGKSRDKLTGHLKSDDFFDVANHPTATFELKEHRDDHLHGTLTIRGVSQDVALPAQVSGHPDRGWILAGKFSFDRMQYGVDYQNKGILGFLNAAKSKLIDDLIAVEVSIKL